MAAHIALYGKGGVGTSTTAANISAALAESGHRVMQIGFDPRHDSTEILRGEQEVGTIYDALREPARRGGEKEIIVSGFKGVLCMESGLPVSDAACLGNGSAAVIAFLKERRFLTGLDPDFVIYDISGEALCGCIAASLLNDLAERVFIVSSADFMSISAANNIFRGITRHTAGVPLGGIIANGLTASFAETIMADFALKTGTRIAGTVPRSLVVTQSALFGRTVIEAAPLSNQAYFYRRLARHMVGIHDTFVPVPLSSKELKEWARGWGEMILEMESGVIRGGAGI